MNVKPLPSACVLILGTAAGLAGPPPASVTVDPNDPRLYPRVADPNDPEKTRATISREEREKLGLTPHTWSGVVDPEVYASLDRVNKTLARLKDRMNKDKDVRAFHAWFAGVETEGTVYVQVHLKDKTAQRRVLASLKASEFRLRQLFEGAAGFVGHASKEALDKLAKNPDVTGVCVDDLPLPQSPVKIIHRDDLPPPKPGQPAGPGAREDRVEPDVYRAFDLTERPYVMIALRADSLPELTDKPSEMWDRNEAHRRAAKQLRDRVLATVSADDFWLHGTTTSTVAGFISREGLQKVWQHPEIARITLVSLVRYPGAVGGRTPLSP